MPLSMHDMHSPLVPSWPIEGDSLTMAPSASRAKAFGNVADTPYRLLTTAGPGWRLALVDKLQPVQPGTKTTSLLVFEADVSIATGRLSSITLRLLVGKGVVPF